MTPNVACRLSRRNVERSGKPLIQAFSTASFQSLWYWIFSVTAWIVVVNRPMGVPYGLVLRAQRDNKAAAHVDDLGRISAERLSAFHDRSGVATSALMGFVLACLLILGVVTRIELARAALALLFPISIVGYSNLRLALAVKRKRMQGADLRRSLTKRWFWHSLIAGAAMFAAAGLAVRDHPRLLLP